MNETLEELVTEYLDHNEIYRFEGDKGVEDLNTFVKALNPTGYREEGYRYGSSLERFLSDNPGACEAIVEWVKAQDLQEWRESIESELPVKNVVISFDDEASVVNASERISYVELDRADFTLEVEPDDLTPDLRDEFRALGATFNDEEDEDNRPGRDESHSLDCASRHGAGECTCGKADKEMEEEANEDRDRRAGLYGPEYPGEIF